MNWLSTSFPHLGRALLIGLALAVIAPAIPATVPLPGAGVGIAEATVAQEKDRDRQKGKNQGNDQDEDHVLNGQVLEINTLKDPPELVVASVDGLTVVRVLKTDEIARNGVHLGDYVELDGEKQDETLFEATQISVSERYKGEAQEKDKKK